MKSLCIGFSNDKDVFISEQLLPIISILLSINNYKSENAAQRNYSSDNELIFTSNEKKSKQRYKKDTPLRQSKKYRTQVE